MTVHSVYYFNLVVVSFMCSAGYQYILCCKMYNVHCTFYTLFTIQCVQCIVSMYIVHTIRYTHCTLYALYTVHTIHCIVYSLHCVVCTMLLLGIRRIPSWYGSTYINYLPPLRQPFMLRDSEKEMMCNVYILYLQFL